MLTLALETSTERGSIALGNAQETFVVREFEESKRHASTLFAALQGLASELRQIQRIIVGLGPGSFSGIRVGLAAAHGIALASGAEVVGVCSAWSVAQQFREAGSLGIFADARRGEYYCTAFHSGRLLAPTHLFPQSELDTQVARYDLAVSAQAFPAIGTRAFPRAADYLRLPVGSPELTAGPDLEPIYLRAPVATQPTCP